MDAKEYRWHVVQVRSRYEYLKLSFEQAEQVYNMEQVLDEPAPKEYFTEWERLDFELATMRRILSAEQLAVYLPAQAEAVEFHAQQVTDAATATAELAYYQENLRYRQEVILPTLYGDENLILTMRMLAARIGKHRLQFVWAECDRLLRRQWQQAVLQHYRHYRDLAEPTLEKARLVHELQTLWPDYRLFTTSLYKPARLILKVALRDYDYQLDEHLPRLTAWQKEWAASANERLKAHLGPAIGFGSTLMSTEKQRRRSWLFLLLWLSRTIPPPLPATPPAKRSRNPKAT